HANWGNWMRAAGVDGQGFGHSGSRWFNLDEERRRFDPKGNYVRLWVAELSQVAQEYLHAPWTMPVEEQQRAGCFLGTDYPVCPESPSKLALEGGDVAAKFPKLFSTTREGKMKGKGKGKRRAKA
ncbi:cry, partial [Symbiodinium pilosum]